jgi:dipeptidyl aminopeptidase/acylaminoacyl peptidase
MSVWIVEADGAARLLYRPAPGKGLPLQWSSDGRYLTGVEMRPGDSAVRLLLLDVASGRVTDLGNTAAQQSIQWSAEGRLAFVRGSGDLTWRDKELVVREQDGSERVVTPPGFVGLAPAWDPARGRLAWIAGPAGDGSGYLEGTGVGDRRVVVSDLAGGTTEIRCPGRVVEGVRWSRDGEALLLLCRRPGATSDVFELWLHRLNSRAGPAAVRVLAGLGWDDYFDRQTGRVPTLSRSVAWSRAIR